MFKPTERQMDLLGDGVVLAEGSRRRLERSWAIAFQRKVLPILLQEEARFAVLYDDKGEGRPNWSVARILGLLLLQELRDDDDQEVLDKFSYDARYQIALGVSSANAYLSRRTYVGFRSRLVEKDPGGALLRGVFESIGKAAIDDLELSTTEQRLDSTHISSNIQARGRAHLFGSTVRHFYNWLKRRFPAKAVLLSDELRAWCEAEPSGWFGSKSSKERLAILQQRAQWAVEMQGRFASDAEVNDSAPYKCVDRLVREQCEVADADDEGDDGTGNGSAGGGGKPVAVRKKPDPVGSSMQSPFDLGAGYGHKGTGYEVHVAETCRNRGPEILTDFEVVAGNVSDRNKAAEVIDRLIASDRAPSTMYADSGYMSAAASTAATGRGVTLHAPLPQDQLPDGHVGREAFVFAADGRALRCPRGHAPARHKLRKSNNHPHKTLHAYFSAAHCRECPLLGRCAVRGNSLGPRATLHLDTNRRLRLRDELLAAQRTQRWRAAYAIRSGVEATMSELKRAHGLRKLRVRGRARVLVAVTMKIAACNTKRWLRARSERTRHSQEFARIAQNRPSTPGIGPDRRPGRTTGPNRHRPMQCFPAHPCHHRQRGDGCGGHKGPYSRRMANTMPEVA